MEYPIDVLMSISLFQTPVLPSAPVSPVYFVLVCLCPLYPDSRLVSSAWASSGFDSLDALVPLATAISDTLGAVL